MSPTEAPFSEAVLSYSTSEYPFAEHVQRFLLSDASGEVALEDLHRIPGFQPRKPRGESQGQRRLNLSPISDPGFREVYHRFVRDFVLPHLQADALLFEDSPNLRVHAPRGGRTVGPHIDADFGHSECEVNFWLPLTDASHDTATIWAESSPGRGDFHPFRTLYGQVVRFYGNQCLHFARENLTEGTRVSLDFRAVRLRDFGRSGIPLAGEGGPGRWTLFGFYSVMSSSGLVPREAWGSTLAAAARPSPGAACPPRPAEGGPLPGQRRRSSGSPQQAPPGGAAHAAAAAAAGPRRRRSSSPEHRARCEALHGSGRQARLSCARCSWIAVRARYLKALVYVSAAGEEEPWVGENPDPSAPWGLGCLLCHAAAARGRGGGPGAAGDDRPSGPRSAYATFAFGSGGSSGGVLMEALLRHGGNWEVCSGELHAGWSEHRLALRACGGSVPPVGAKKSRMLKVV